MVPGTRLGSYEVVALVGAGGMGEVYRARDTMLHRDVALKILPDAFAHDAERVGRFAREAQTLAALNHPHIATIYGLVEAPASVEGGLDGAHVHALAMELVEGDDLSAVIARGPLPIEDALPIARQLADALEAAHDQGIVHRDLKPANIKIRADGTVKVLDFGLAKALDPAGAPGAWDVSNSPTQAARAPGLYGAGGTGTQAGTLLGTAAYMAPEQARGRAVDRRADIWAFGAVVYEMLTGRRAFPGDDVSEILASVLKTDPDWGAVPSGTPPSVRRLLRRCLEKEPRRRLSAIGDARLELDDTEPVAAAPAAPPPARRSFASRSWPAVLAMAVTAAAAAIFWPSSPAAPATPLSRLSVLPPPGLTIFPDSNGVAISPDGTKVAFVTGSISQTDTQLWVRDLESMTARRLEGADGVLLPFWSPDSQRIGFFTNSKLKTISVTGGRAEVLCDAPNGRGGAWTPSNVIVFAPDAAGPLFRVNANGGTPTRVTTLDQARREYGHRFPALLPDNDHFLYVALPGKNGRFDVFAGSLSDPSRTLVGSQESAPVYADPGWLLTTRQGLLAAVPFDARTRSVTGPLVTLADEPAVILDPSGSYTAGRTVSVSASGALAYFSLPSINTVPVWVDQAGRIAGALPVPAGHYDHVTISPDGTRAILVQSTSPSESTLWLVDLGRGGASPLTSGHGRHDSPVWSPDGASVVFAADRDGPQNLFVKKVSDASPERPLLLSEAMFKAPQGWSPDSRWLVFMQLDPDTAQNLWLLGLGGGDRPKPYLQGPVRDLGGVPSPDGRWLLYGADDTGRFELYAQSFPQPGHKVQVSQNGVSSEYWWANGGRQIVYAGGDLRSLLRVDVQQGSDLRIGEPKTTTPLPPGVITLDAMPDRQRFLALVPERAGTGSITVVQNWRAAAAGKR